MALLLVFVEKTKQKIIVWSKKAQIKTPHCCTTLQKGDALLFVCYALLLWSKTNEQPADTDT